ncbi:Tetratricopeptide repeat family protein [Borrelia crocidurae DOU]|uniref:Tetratricopeptide repeat family protein n=1 Tax=Borrelia crocidurae DOU TaxID=1293575 RepID=W5SH31_9SPIR|nr:Tetratricopeptide repeat family protein [Borrelia crocidurae DOU]
METAPKKLINKSINYYNSHKYADVIKLIEKEIFFYKDYYIYHYILGMSYLRMGNLGNAQIYLKKSLYFKSNRTRCQTINSNTISSSRERRQSYTNMA